MQDIKGLVKDLVENSFDGIYFVDRDRKILYWNQSAEIITGYKKEEVIGNRCSNNLLLHIDQKGVSLCGNGCPLHRSMEDGLPREDEIFLHHKDGYRVPVTVRIVPVRDNDEITGAFEIFKSKSDSGCYIKVKELEEEALLDPLTKLPNRRFMDNALVTGVEHYKRYEWDFGVLFFDIDNFKRFNDTYGHSAGDNILVAVANTLQKNLRSSDIVGRWGGEEFVGIIDKTGSDDLKEIAEKMRSLVQGSSIDAGGEQINVTVSVGGSVIRPDDDKHSIVHRADALMYESKSRGKNTVTVR